MRRHFRESMESTLDLCQYNVRAFTDPELDALEEYDEKVVLKPFFDLERLLEEEPDAAAAFRRRAEELTDWHNALLALLADPRLIPVYGPHERRAGLPEDYTPAVARYLSWAADGYHQHRQGFEYDVTLWALGLRAPGVYPPQSCRLDLKGKVLKQWRF